MSHFPFMFNLIPSLTKAPGLFHSPTAKRASERARQRTSEMIKGLKNDAYKRCQDLLLFSQEEEKNDQGGLLNCYSGICIPGPGDRGQLVSSLLRM